jgi:lysozyme family protein
MTAAPIPTFISGLVAREGGYVNNPTDQGGETTYGITVATARAYGYDGPMQDMSRGLASEIYANRYWLTPGFDRLYPIDSALSAKLFDVGVNLGPATGVLFLQRALNVLNVGNMPYPDLRRDGQLGPLTLHALTALYALRGAAAQPVVMAMVRGQQATKYIELAEAQVSQEVFEFGWQRARTLY